MIVYGASYSRYLDLEIPLERELNVILDVAISTATPHYGSYNSSVTQVSMVKGKAVCN